MNASALELTAVVTRACPFDCTYCAQLHPAKSIAREDLRRGVDLLLKEEGPLVLQYFGGEPLLEYDLVLESIRESRRAAERRGKTLDLMMTTSLLPLTPARARELAALGVRFLASLDGGPETQMRQRPTASRGV